VAPGNAAIERLEREVEARPDDAELRLRLGDQYLKVGRISEACDAYSIAADVHTRDGGNFLRSIALRRQLLEVAPERIDDRRKLIEMYRVLGMASEAEAQEVLLKRWSN
jgi:tetratricopeptide (TPR) repeat protein